MTAAARLLDRLEGVRQTGSGRWIAKCPAHEDRSPSLSIRETDDGRILLHDFAGCDVQSVLGAIGLSLADLFPERLTHHLALVRDRRHWHAAREALRSVSEDALLVAVAAENLAQGVTLDEHDRHLLAEAVTRIREARGIAT